MTPASLTRPSLRAGMPILALLCSLGCSGEELPGEEYTGTLQAKAPIETPLSKTPACVIGVELYSRSQPGQSSTSRFAKSELRWAEGTTLETSGEVLRVQGSFPSLGLSESGESWTWTPGERPIPVPEWVLGWGHDSTLEALNDPKVTHYYKQVEATEKYVRCGQTVTLRASRNGETLNMVDTSSVDSSNAFRLFGWIAAVFFVCFVLPTVLFVVWVIRRKKKSG